MAAVVRAADALAVVPGWRRRGDPRVPGAEPVVRGLVRAAAGHGAVHPLAEYARSGSARLVVWRRVHHRDAVLAGAGDRAWPDPDWRRVRLHLRAVRGVGRRAARTAGRLAPLPAGPDRGARLLDRP